MNDVPEVNLPDGLQIVPPSGGGWCDPVTGVCHIAPDPDPDGGIEAETTPASAEGSDVDASGDADR